MTSPPNLGPPLLNPGGGMWAGGSRGFNERPQPYNPGPRPVSGYGQPQYGQRNTLGGIMNRFGGGRGQRF